MSAFFITGTPRARLPLVMIPRTVYVLCLAFTLLLAANSPAQTGVPVWTDIQVESDVAYLLRKSPSQIMRYDFGTTSWLSPISLAEIPVSFAIDSSHIFISYGRKIERIDKDGTNLVHVINTVEDVIDLFIDGNVLFANRTSGSYARFTTIDKTTFAAIDTFENYIDSLYGASIAPSLNKLFGRTQGISPSDISYVDYDDAGMLLSGGDGPYHGAYPGAVKTWVFPDETKVVDSSGTVYNTTDLTYNNSFGVLIDELAFHGIDIPIVLAGDELISYSNTILETGRYTLAQEARSVVVHGSDVYAFYEDSALPTKVDVEIVPLSALTPDAPGTPISPVGLAYEIDSSAIDSAGIVYLLSKSFNSIFRWDINAQAYLDTISLPEASDIVVYSEDLDRLYVYAPSRKIYRIDLGTATPTPVLFATVPLTINKLISLDDDLMALRNGSWEDQWIYDENGALLLTPVSCCYDNYHFYDPGTGLLYYDSYAIPYLGNGVFGAVTGGYISGFSPIRLSPDGLLMIDALGRVYNASDRSQIDSLSNDIVRAVWDGGNQLFTLEKPVFVGSVPGNVTTVQRWSEYYANDLELHIGGQYRELFSFADRLLVITSREGVPSFTTLDAAFDIIAPASLATPQLAISNFSATAVTLIWDDIFGEEGYVIERKLDVDADWTEIGSVPFDVTSFTDLNLVTGVVYQFRIKAVNDGLESGYSPVAELDLQGVIDDRVDPTTVSFVPDDILISAGDVLYLLSRAYESIFTWDVSQQRWGTTIPLEGAALFFTYSQENNALYTLYADGTINSIGLAAANPVEIQFATLTRPSMCGLISAGEFIIGCDASSNWEDHTSFDAAGYMIDTRGTRYPLNGGVWNAVNRRIYHLRDGTSPNDLIADNINPDGTLGNYVDSPYHSSTGIQHPVRVKPDGTIVLLGSGRIYDATTLEQIDALANPISDAVWINGNMVTLASSTVYSHTLPSYATQAEIDLTGTGLRILPTSDDRLVTVSANPNGGISIDVYDSGYTLSPPASLAMPTGLSAAVASSSVVDLSWNDGGGELNFRIERKLSSASAWATIGTVGMNVTIFSDATVVAGNDYDYRVTAVNGALESLPSDPVTASLMVPPAPTNLLATALSSTEIQVTWDDTSLETNYQLERRTGAGGSWSIVATPGANEMSFTNQFLIPNTFYEYRILALNGIGNSPYSNVDGAMTDAVPPSTPSLSTPGVTAVSVSLSWTNSNYEDIFVIERSPGGANSWAVIATNPADDTTYTDTDVSVLTNYDYRVKATNVAGDSNYSNVRSVSIPQLPAPNAPTGLSARTISAGEIEITWNDVSVETGFRLERRTDEPTSWEVLEVFPADTTSYSDTSVIEGTEYWYRVVAFNAIGDSPYSNVDSARPANIVCVLEDNFDEGIDVAAWAEVLGGTSVNGGQGFLGSNALWFGGSGLRRATTAAVDVSLGGNLEFTMRAGNQAVDGNTFWNNSESIEDVVIEYSTNGIVWSVIQTLDTTYPNLSTWNNFSIPIPGPAYGTSTAFRWRQLSNSGASFDTWALEDFCVQAMAPAPPPAPSLVIASANSPTQVAVFWIGVPGATSYTIERIRAGVPPAPVGATPGSQPFFVDTTASPSTLYGYRVRANNAGGSSPFSSFANVITFSQLDYWRFENYGSTEADGPAASDAHGVDGIMNLAKFAFNLDAGDSFVYLSGGGTRGMPRFFYDYPSRKLCVEFIRRKVSMNPAIAYYVEFCDDGTNWRAEGSAQSVTPIDAIWERVIWEDGISADTAPVRLCRVRVDEVEVP